MVARAILLASAALALHGCAVSRADKGMRAAGITSVSVRHIKGSGIRRDAAQTPGVIRIRTADCPLRHDDGRAVFDVLSAAEPVSVDPNSLHPPENKVEVLIVFRGPDLRFTAAVPTFAQSQTGSLILFKGAPRRLAPESIAIVNAAMKRSGCSESARWQ